MRNGRVGRKSRRTTIRSRSTLTCSISKNSLELLGPHFHDFSNFSYLSNKEAKAYASEHFSAKTHQGTSANTASSLQTKNTKNIQTANTTTTNATLDEDILNASLLIDTGFSGVGVVGDRTLAISRRQWPQRFRRTLRNPPKPTKFIFGSGEPVIARKKVLVNHPLFGVAEFDVVPGRLPFLVGRKLLKRAKISIDFDKNIIELP